MQIAQVHNEIAKSIDRGDWTGADSPAAIQYTKIRVAEILSGASTPTAVAPAGISDKNLQLSDNFVVLAKRCFHEIGEVRARIDRMIDQGQWDKSSPNAKQTLKQIISDGLDGRPVASPALSRSDQLNLDDIVELANNGVTKVIQNEQSREDGLDQIGKEVDSYFQNPPGGSKPGDRAAWLAAHDGISRIFDQYRWAGQSIEDVGFAINDLAKDREIRSSPDVKKVVEHWSRELPEQLRNVEKICDRSNLIHSNVNLDSMSWGDLSRHITRNLPAGVRVEINGDRDPSTSVSQYDSVISIKVHSEVSGSTLQYEVPLARVGSNNENLGEYSSGVSLLKRVLAQQIVDPVTAGERLREMSIDKMARITLDGRAPVVSPGIENSIKAMLGNSFTLESNWGKEQDIATRESDVWRGRASFQIKVKDSVESVSRYKQATVHLGEHGEGSIEFNCPQGGAQVSRSGLKGLAVGFISAMLPPIGGSNGVPKGSPVGSGPESIRVEIGSQADRYADAETIQGASEMRQAIWKRLFGAMSSSPAEAGARGAALKSEASGADASQVWRVITDPTLGNHGLTRTLVCTDLVLGGNGGPMRELFKFNDISHAKFRRVLIHGADMDDVVATHTKFDDCGFGEVKAKNAHLEHIKMHGCRTIAGSRFDLSGSALNNADLGDLNIVYKSTVVLKGTRAENLRHDGGAAQHEFERGWEQGYTKERLALGLRHLALPGDSWQAKSVNAKKIYFTHIQGRIEVDADTYELHGAKSILAVRKATGFASEILQAQQSTGKRVAGAGGTPSTGPQHKPHKVGGLIDHKSGFSGNVDETDL